MARLVTKFKYLKPTDRMRPGGYAKYIATREGVDKIDDSQKFAAATEKQKELIQKLLRDFPDSRNSLEYEDYQKNGTVAAASEWITHTLEENAAQMMGSKTYADYIATRPRAQRFGSHGLFTDDGVQVQLSKVSEELNRHTGNVWTAIISLRREDAERLGFHTGERWRDMLRSQTEALSTALHIPMQHLRWFAAFHNESHHPHVHLIAYSTRQGEGYLSKAGVDHLRASFARDIFAQDLLCVYEKQTAYRDDLKAHSRDLVADIVSQINTGIYDAPGLASMLTELARRLAGTGGKKVYGYLKADVKDLIDRIVDEIAADERVAKLYALWYEQRENVIGTYTEALPERVKLSQNREFRSMKNMVIQEALHIAEGRLADPEQDEDVPGPQVEDPQQEDIPHSEPTEPDMLPPSPGRKEKAFWWTDGYKTARMFLYGTKTVEPDFKKALVLMQKEAGRKNGFAMYDLGRMYLSGLGCEKDAATAQKWFAASCHALIQAERRAEKPDYLQYRIGKLFSFGYGVEQDHQKAAQWYEKAVMANNPFAAYSLGSLYHRGQGVERDDSRAFSLYEMAANHERKPNAYAMYELGRMCRDGTGTAADLPASEMWYARAYRGFAAIAEDMADDKLYYRLGQMCMTGTGTEKNLADARAYFEKAAAFDNADALYGLGQLYMNGAFEQYSMEKAMDYFFSAARKGHSYAQYTLGKLLLTGEGISENVTYGLYWLEQAARQDNVQAQCLLGKVLLAGDAVEQDPDRAAALLTKAAESGSAYAAYLLGMAYLDGAALPQDISKGLENLSQSAAQGYASAEYALGKLLYRGQIIPQDTAKALALLERAAQKDHACAACLAGTIRLAAGDLRDVPLAIYLLKKAAGQGNDHAQYQLGKLYLCGKDVEQDVDLAIRCLTASAEHGSQYARQLLHSIYSGQNWSAAMGSLRLLHYLSRLIQSRIEDGRREKGGGIDRKLKRKIDEKKQALGLRQG